MAIEDNQVLLKLVIRGLDPEEVQRLAQESYGQLKQDAAQHIDALTDYMRQAEAARQRIAKDSNDQQAQDDADLADAKIKSETKVLDAVTKLMRQQEIEANKARESWHRVMEDLENITTVAEGAFEVMAKGWESLKSGMEEIIKDTNIYNSLTGSIEPMKAATDGLVANIDLISAKNRGMEKDLKLTDEEFGVVAAQATHYAHAVGIDVKEALDKLIDGLATGKEKMLSHAGIMKEDLADANQKWIDKMGGSIEAMTEQDKLLALQAEAIDTMKTKQAEAAEEADNLAAHMERGWIRLKNAVTDAAAAIGNIKVNSGLSAGLSAEDAASQADEDAAAKDAAEEAARKRKADAAWQEEDQLAPEGGGSGTDDNLAKARQKMKVGDKRGDAAAAKAEAERQRDAASVDALYRKLAGSSNKTSSQGLDPDADLATKAAMSTIDIGGTEEEIKASEKANEAIEKQALSLEKLKGVSVDATLAYERFAKSVGVSADALSHDEKMQAIDSEAKVQFAAVQKRLLKEEDARRAELKATKARAGFLSIFLWGPDGPDQTYKEMDEFSQYMTDTTGQMSSMISSAAGQMTKAMGASLAAQISGDNAHRKSIKETTHDVLESLAAQATSRALMEAAEGLASLATGNPIEGALAAEHFAAAAAFGALGVSSGIAARAFNGAAQSSSAPSSASASAASGAGSSAGDGMSTSSQNQGASGRRSSSAQTSDQPAAPITIYVNTLPGNEIATGRAVAAALDAVHGQDGYVTTRETEKGVWSST